MDVIWPEAVAQVVRQRLHAQHLTGEPLPTVADAVRHSLAVQAQDPPLSRWSLGLRTGMDDAEVRRALSAGEIVRTHVLRPTWHYVHPDDLRWLLALTSPKVISSMGARHRQLMIDDQVYALAEAAMLRELSQQPMTRKQLQPHLPIPDWGGRPGEVVGHLLMVAELRGLICSGPLLEGEHSYCLVDDVIAPSPAVDREVALDRLVRRFVHGHGPTSIRDLQRWCTITKREAQAVFASDDFAHARVNDVDLWWLAGSDHGGDLGGVLLLPTFDEAFLSHDRPRFPRLEGHRLGSHHINAAEAGAGFVIVDGVDVGTFKRVKKPRTIEVDFDLVDTFDSGRLPDLQAAADQMVRFFSGQPR